MSDDPKEVIRRTWNEAIEAAAKISDMIRDNLEASAEIRKLKK